MIYYMCHLVFFGLIHPQSTARLAVAEVDIKTYWKSRCWKQFDGWSSWI